TIWYVAVQTPGDRLLGGALDANTLDDKTLNGDALDGGALDGDNNGRTLKNATLGGGGGGGVDGYGAVVARLYARSGWNEPAAYLHPSASPGGFTHRYPSTLASPVFSVGYWPMRRSVLSSAHQSPLAPPLRLVSMTW